MSKDSEKLIAAILSGEITEEQARNFLSEAATSKPKRGRPKKIITSIKNKRVGRPISEESAEKKLMVMTLWIALEKTGSIPKMVRRNLIATCVNKSISFVDKALVDLKKYKKLGWVYVAKESPYVMFATPKDVDKIRFAEKLGVNTSDVFKKKLDIDTTMIYKKTLKNQDIKNSSEITKK